MDFKRNNVSWIKIVRWGYLFIIFISFLVSAEDNNVPPMLKRPDGTDSAQKKVEVEVCGVKIRAQSGNSVIIAQNDESNSQVVKGKDAIAYITSVLGLNDVEEIYRERRSLEDIKNGNPNFTIIPGIIFYLNVIDNNVYSDLYTLQTKVIIDHENKPVDAIRASAKAKIGEPLVYKGIMYNGDEYIIVVTLIQSDQGDGSGQGDINQEKTVENQPELNQAENKNLSEASKQEENKGDEEKEKQQILLLLESLEEMDQKEQKEMLNQREKILSPKEWW